jgi:DeoR family transcriptional regulator, carbon catabolite repression regulator
MVKRQMVKQGEYVIAVADHTKLATTGFFKVCDLPEIDLLITDQQPDIELQAALAAANVTIYVTE